MAHSKDKNKVKYWAHKEYTKGRIDKAGNPIEFRLSFDEWLSIWVSSGHYEDRGCHNGQYCMSRYNDLGHYEVGNVSIVPIEQNLSEACKGIPKKWSKPPLRVNKGVPLPQHLKDLLSKANSKPVTTPIGNFPSVRSACEALRLTGPKLREAMRKYPTEYYFS